MGFKVMITGASGMVGEAVMIECLENEAVETVLLINRSALDRQHPKLKEVLHQDWSEFESIREQLAGYDACFHCMGVSSIGMNEADYTKYTYDYTHALVESLYRLTPEMTFNYVSGTGTDRTEAGNTMWARVKGRTENMVFDRGFGDAYAFRPGMILPEKGIQSKTSWLNTLLLITRPLYPLFRRMDSILNSSDLGLAMINTLRFPQKLKVLENKDIELLARRNDPAKEV